MFHQLVKQQIRQGFLNISQGKWEAVVNQFASDVHFSFAGSHAMGGDFHKKETARQWFERTQRLFPTLEITARQIYVSGVPWDIRAVTQFRISDTLPDGQAYQNAGVQILRIKLGKIVEDHLIEDTQVLINALQHLAELGVEEALAPALCD